MRTRFEDDGNFLAQARRTEITAARGRRGDTPIGQETLLVLSYDPLRSKFGRAMNTRKIISVLFLTLALISALALFHQNNPIQPNVAPATTAQR